MVVGFENNNPILNLGGQVREFPREAIDVSPVVDLGVFSVGTTVDSGFIRLFKHLNRGEIVSVHEDGMVMVQWDREGACLQHISELRKTSTIWEHLKDG
jgi:hypothetical protein